jgi:DNA mismatch endonuclease (patch repair protein)
MKTVARDKSNYRQLRKLGWKVFVLWECALKGNEPRKLRKLKEDLIAIQESLPAAHED